MVRTIESEIIYAYNTLKNIKIDTNHKYLYLFIHVGV